MVIDASHAGAQLPGIGVEGLQSLGHRLRCGDTGKQADAQSCMETNSESRRRAHRDEQLETLHLS